MPLLPPVSYAYDDYGLCVQDSSIIPLDVLKYCTSYALVNSPGARNDITRVARSNLIMFLKNNDIVHARCKELTKQKL